jgi:hypothetical protein
MAQLERSPQGLKMGELSKRMMVTGGNVTGITDQLVAEKLVVREDSPNDRRAYIVKLTPEGAPQLPQDGRGPRDLGGRALRRNGRKAAQPAVRLAGGPQDQRYQGGGEEVIRRRTSRRRIAVTQMQRLDLLQ